MEKRSIRVETSLYTKEMTIQIDLAAYVLDEKEKRKFNPRKLN